MPDMNPLDPALTTDCIRQTVQAVSHDAIDPLDTRGGESFGELVGNGFHVSTFRS
jgi:hypothetical protein